MNKKNKIGKLSITKETIRELTVKESSHAMGGALPGGGVCSVATRTGSQRCPPPGSAGCTPTETCGPSETCGPGSGAC
jgi:hypothetical protein